MSRVRIASTENPEMRKYVGRVGEFIGFSGQFVKVRFDDSHSPRLFSTNELEVF